MKNSKLRERLRKNRPMAMISLRIPEDVIEDLKKIAPKLGFSGYQPLMRAYIGQGLRMDMARLGENAEVAQFVESLKKYGVEEDIIASAMADLEGMQKAA